MRSAFRVASEGAASARVGTKYAGASGRPRRSVGREGLMKTRGLAAVAGVALLTVASLAWGDERGNLRFDAQHQLRAVESRLARIEAAGAQPIISSYVISTPYVPASNR